MLPINSNEYERFYLDKKFIKYQFIFFKNPKEIVHEIIPIVNKDPKLCGLNIIIGINKIEIAINNHPIINKPAKYLQFALVIA